MGKRTVIKYKLEKYFDIFQIMKETSSYLEQLDERIRARHQLYQELNDMCQTEEDREILKHEFKAELDLVALLNERVIYRKKWEEQQKQIMDLSDQDLERLFMHQSLLAKYHVQKEELKTLIAISRSSLYVEPIGHEEGTVDINLVKDYALLNQSKEETAKLVTESYKEIEEIPNRKEVPKPDEPEIDSETYFSLTLEQKIRVREARLDMILNPKMDLRNFELEKVKYQDRIYTIPMAWRGYLYDEIYYLKQLKQQLNPNIADSKPLSKDVMEYGSVSIVPKNDFVKEAIEELKHEENQNLNQEKIIETVEDLTPEEKEKVQPAAVKKPKTNILANIKRKAALVLATTVVFCTSAHFGAWLFEKEQNQTNVVSQVTKLADRSILGHQEKIVGEISQIEEDSESKMQAKDRIESDHSMVKIGDRIEVLEGSSIYYTMEDAIEKRNPDTPYFGYDKNQERYAMTVGIKRPNGEIKNLSIHMPDYQQEYETLLKEGGKVVGVLSFVGNEVEGFYEASSLRPIQKEIGGKMR